MAVGIQPLSDYVVAQKEEVSNKTASGLYIPENAQEKPETANVVAVGKNVSEVKVGDKIVYGGYSHKEVKHAGKDYILIKEEDIYATVK